jgi:lipid II:glycine glycyltransferase (peptidoglycan interpeptide bridge formation enzyme)
MIELRQITDKDKWEAFIAKSSYPTSFFQSWTWGEVERNLGSGIHRLGFFEEGEQVGQGQGIEVNAKRGKFLHFRNGPVLEWRDHDLAKECLRLMDKYGKSIHRDYLRISPLITPDDAAVSMLRYTGYVDSQMHDVDAEITWVMDLTQSEQEILKNMRKHHRYYIRKAEREGVEIIKTKDDQYMDDFWNVYEDTFKRQGWNAYSKKSIVNEFKQFASADQAQMFLAKYKGKIIAASIFIYYQDQCYYHHSGSLTEFKDVTAPYLIQWESIKEAKKRGLKVYNFFGIARDDSPKHPWYGLTFFKKGFGGYEHRWMHAKDKPLRLRYWITNFYERYERLKRGY